ncbi:hypothetical protein CSUI_008967 [Cystoisospora suis]|uniref:Transmembrane protein n=1 Tax=Cystoisospora suis TaxID=483139 RepID=A0A2C6JK70_9APIC|nr:hypothetical protein CSUI_008967 [Cystoisospora suis]
MNERRKAYLEYHTSCHSFAASLALLSLIQYYSVGYSFFQYSSVTLDRLRAATLLFYHLLRQ